MTDETFGDAFDTAGEADDSSNAIFRRAETLDDTKRFAEGLFHEGALYNSPVIQGETDLARAAWQKAEQMSGGHVVEAAVEGFQEVTEEKPADLWERIEPDHDLGTYAEPAIDETGTAALGSAQLGINLIENLAPGSELKPAIDLAGEGYKEFKDWAGPDDSGHFKDPEIPETDAMGANVVSDAVTAAPDTDPYVASYLGRLEHLRHVVGRHVQLRHVHLRHVQLRHVQLRHVQLRHVQLRHVQLRRRLRRVRRCLRIRRR